MAALKEELCGLIEDAAADNVVAAEESLAALKTELSALSSASKEVADAPASADAGEVQALGIKLDAFCSSTEASLAALKEVTEAKLEAAVTEASLTALKEELGGLIESSTLDAVADGSVETEASLAALKTELSTMIEDAAADNAVATE